MYIETAPVMNDAPIPEPLDLKTPYPWTMEYISRVPFRDGVYTLLDAHQKPVAVACGTLTSDMWREVNLQPKDAVKWFVVEKMDGTAKDMQDFVDVLKAAYDLLPRKPIGFRPAM